MQISTRQFSVLLVIFSCFYTLISGGPIRFMLDALEREGLPHVELPQEFEDKLIETMQILLSPNQNKTVIQNGMPTVQCDTTWNFYNSSTKTLLLNKNLYMPLLRDHLENIVNADLGKPSLTEYLYLYDQFASGAQLSKFIVNYDPCRTYAGTTVYYWYYFYNYYKGNNIFENKNQTFSWYLDNITLTISNTSTLGSVCTSAVQGTQYNTTDYIAEFSSFSDYLLAFLMNLTGNVVSMITIMNQIITANNNCDLSSISYNAGRLVRVILIEVSPIEEVVDSSYMMQHSLEYEMASTAFDNMKGFLMDVSKQVKEKQARSKEEGEYPDMSLMYSENYRPLQRKVQKPDSNIVEDIQTIIPQQPPIAEIDAQSVATEYILPAFNASVGFLNGTKLYGGMNSVLCQSTVENYINLLSYEIVDDILALDIYETIYDTLSIFTYTYALQSSCKGSFVEAYDQVNLYKQGYEDIWDFLDILAFNFGLLYDSVVTGIVSYQRGNYFMSGYSVGHILYLIFFYG